MTRPRSTPPPPRQRARAVPEAVLRSRYERALALHRAGDLEAAEALYREILAEMPDSFHALHMLGVLAGQQRNFEQSEQLLQRAVALDPASAAAHTNLGNTLRVLARFDEALAQYDHALRLQPDGARALKGRGLALWELDRRDEALQCYDRLLALEPTYADGWIMKGAALNHLDRNDEAVACYRRALELDNDGKAEAIRYRLASLGHEPVPAASPIEYVRELFDKYARNFEEHLVDLLKYRTPELLAAVIARHQPAVGDVLDLGCGTGLCGPLLRPWARHLTGLDLSPKMVEEARAKGAYDELVVGEIVAYLAGQVARFDLIVAADVFVYIGDLSAVFAGVQAALRPGGLFAFSTEVSEAQDMVLEPSLRYAHSSAYVRRLAAQGDYAVESLELQALRQENHEDVTGQLVVLRRL